MQTLPRLIPRQVTFIITVWLPLLLPHFSHADIQTLRVAVYDTPPLSCTDTSDRCLFDEVLRHIAGREKWRLVFIPGSLQEGMERLADREVDLLLAAPYNRQLEDRYRFSKETVLSTWAQVYVQPGEDVSSLLDLDGLVVGVKTDDPYNEEKSPIHVAPLIKEALKLLRASIPTTIEFQADIQDDAGLILADPTQVHQIIMNLCTNAAQAMDEKNGRLGIELSNLIIDDETARLNMDLNEGPYVSQAEAGRDSQAGAGSELINPERAHQNILRNTQYPAPSEGVLSTGPIGALFDPAEPPGLPPDSKSAEQDFRSTPEIQAPLSERRRWIAEPNSGTIQRDWPHRQRPGPPV